MSATWRLVESDGRRVVVRGQGVSGRLRATMESHGATSGHGSGTLGSVFFGTLAFGIPPGLLATLLASVSIGGDSPGFIGIGVGLVAMVIAWLVITLRSDAADVEPQTVLDELVHLSGLSNVIQVTRAEAHFAGRAIGRVPDLEQVENLPSLPDLVRTSAEAMDLAAQLGVAEVAPGVRDVWDDLIWREDEVRAATDRMAALVSELRTLAIAQRALVERADRPVTEALAVEQRWREEQVDNKLSLGLEAVRRETEIRRAALDE